MFTRTRRLAAAPTLLGGGAEPSALHRNDITWALPSFPFRRGRFHICPFHKLWFPYFTKGGYKIRPYGERTVPCHFPKSVGAAARRRVLANIQQPVKKEPYTEKLPETPNDTAFQAA